MKKLLWLDDIRDPFLNLEKKVPNDFEYEINWVVNFDGFVEYINKNGLPDVISFDHDLGEDKTGMDCAKWLVEYLLDNKKELPRFFIHSSNPPGSSNIRSLLNNFSEFSF